MVIVNRIGDNIIVSSSKFKQEYSFIYTEDKMDQLVKLSAESKKVRSLKELQDIEAKVIEMASYSYKEKVDSFHPNLTFNPLTKEYFLKTSGGVVIENAIPDKLVNMIKESVDKKLSPEPLLKTWTRFLRNKKSHLPDFKKRFVDYISMTYIRPDVYNKHIENGLSHELATELAKTYEVKITEEGLLATYKCVNEHEVKYVADEEGNPKEVSRFKKKFNEDTGEIEGDNRDDFELEDRIFIPYMQGFSGDSFLCQGTKGYGDKQQHFIKVGCEISLDDWEKVNCNDHQSCVKGLHIGGLSYIASWGADEILTCLVDPANIGAICDYSNFWALRVLKYYVDGSLTSIGNNIYHSSTYSEMTDKQWALELDKIAEHHKDLAEMLEDDLTENLSLQ